MRRGVVVAVTLVFVTAVAPGSESQAATLGKVRALARRATSSPRALAQLKRIRVVDGHRVDIETALEGATGKMLERRLLLLASEDRLPPIVDPVVLRGQTGEVTTGGPTVGEAETPEPPPDAAASEPRERSGDSGGLNPRILLIILGVVVVLIALLAARRAIARRTKEPDEEEDEQGDEDKVPAEDDHATADLETLADAAERDGDFERAIRLRFLAGLARLAAARIVPRRSSLTTMEVSRLLRSRSFEEIARDFDGIVYGRQPAEPAAAERSRSGWAKVLEEAGAR